MPSYAVRLIPLLIGVLVAPRPLTIAETGSIAGHVHDAATGAPIVGAVVEVAGTRWRAITRDSGYFAFSAVPAGRYTVRAMMIGYNRAEATVRVTASSAVALELKLSPSPATLE